MAMKKSALLALTAAAAGIWLAGTASAQQKEIVIGAQCDRTGPTQVVGVVLCPAIQDYANLINSKGGVEGYKIRIEEIDHEYKVPQAIESYEKEKKDGAVSIMIYGTPQTQALTQRLTEDKIPGTSPGFGSAAAADGKRYPYLFPIAATYWSQATGAVSFVKEKLGGNLTGKKIAYIFYDNPAGHEPLPILEDLAKREKFELKTFAVPPPGLEMGAQVLDIAQRYRADFVIAHLFGRSPSVSIKEFKRVGYPLNKVISFVWGAAEADIEAAGGYGVAEGYYTLQFAGVGSDYPVRHEIEAMYKAQGKQPPKEMASTVYYNRGLLTAALHIEAIRIAIKANGGKPPTGEQVARGFESIKASPVGNLAPPLQITATDHEGGGWVEVFQVKGGKLTKVKDWFHAYPQVLAENLKEAK
ncbi:MAG TPA: ABC transporter substrate-binding protein [Candidatus Cybelea sp.]|nr:ABC transporter substrate-binding protein [Candidatus Cybelea sp.]